MAEQASLRDNRRTYRFWIDDAIFDTYGARLGPYAGWVYTYLARRAKEGIAFPSLARIALDTGMSRMSVIRAMKHLEDLHVITKETRTTQFGNHTSNLYTLCDLDHEGQGDTTEEDQGSTSEVPPSIPQVLGVVPVSDQGSPPEIPKGFPLKDAPGEGIYIPPTKQTFPTEPTAQSQLRALLLTADLQAWADHQGLTLPLAREFERWLHHGLASSCKTADFAAAFRLWLLSTLPLSNGCAPSQAKADTRHESYAATRRILQEDSDDCSGQTPVFPGTQNSRGSVRRPHERNTPTGLLVGASAPLHA